jgi:hypothetical protein
MQKVGRSHPLGSFRPAFKDTRTHRDKIAAARRASYFRLAFRHLAFSNSTHSQAVIAHDTESDWSDATGSDPDGGHFHLLFVLR